MNQDNSQAQGPIDAAGMVSSAVMGSAMQLIESYSRSLHCKRHHDTGKDQANHREHDRTQMPSPVVGVMSP